MRRRLQPGSLRAQPLGAPVPAGASDWVGEDVEIDVDVDDRRRSYEQVFLSEYQPMVRLAVLLVDELDVAEELVQDAFVRLHQHWRRVDRPGAYLRTSVVNACRNELRRRQRERRARRHDEAVLSVELGADELLDAVAALPPKRRAAVVLRYYGGLDEREIAETLGVRRGTVKSLLSRGLAELRRTIDLG